MSDYVAREQESVREEKLSLGEYVCVCVLLSAVVRSDRKRQNL